MKELLGSSFPGHGGGGSRACGAGGTCRVPTGGSTGSPKGGQGGGTPQDSFVVAQANSPLNEDGSFVNDVVMARYVSENLEVPVERVDYMDVSPKQVVLDTNFL